MTKQEKIIQINGILFVLPWIIGFLLFVVYPVSMSLYYSFCDYTLFDKPVWIGLGNFIDLFKDDVFWVSLGNTFYFVLIAIPLGLIVSISLALLLNSKVQGRAVYRLIYYLPSLVPGVALAMLWLWMFNAQYGIINQTVSVAGIQGPNWLGDPAWAKNALILMSLWGVGQSIVIYLAGLQDVPVSMLESAEIDGANWFHKIIHIVLPMISPVIFFNVIMAIIGYFQIFALPYIMTKGGPERATTFYALYLYFKAFEDFEMGYASAMAWILFIIILVLTLFANKLSKDKVYYHGA